MSRNLIQQFNFAICSNLHIGESKRQYRMTHHGNVDGRIYSVQTAENLRATAKSLGKYMQKYHPEIKRISNITTEHLQDYIDVHAKGWTQRTILGKISDIRAIFDRVERTYATPLQCEPKDLLCPKVSVKKIRTISFERSDYDMLRQSFDSRGSKTEGRTALELSARCGLRIKEIARLEVQRINLSANVVEIRDGGKNGKHRDVPIRPKDKLYFSDLVDAKKSERLVCGGVSEDSLNRAIRREMKICNIDGKYPSTTNHAIRKMYAKERMEEEKGKGKTEIEAWSVVQEELGHGKEFRLALYETYAY